MLHVELAPDHRWAILKPDGALDKQDFEAAARQIDPVITEHGGLDGLIIYVEKFPGWDSFAALTAHIKFVKEHHRKIRHLAFVTDSKIGGIAESLGSHFVAAEIKRFPFAELDQAKAWIQGS